MLCKTKLEKRQQEMRQRLAPKVVSIPADQITKAVAVFNRALFSGPVLREEVMAQMVRAGVPHSAIEPARIQANVGESHCDGHDYFYRAKARPAAVGVVTTLAQV
jgi:hypothetical protein